MNFMVLDFMIAMSRPISRLCGEFAPTPVDVTFEGREKSDFESRGNLLKNPAECLGDLGCRFVFSQVMGEVSCCFARWRL